jgi:16S rRNA processing protein RimM
MNSIIEIAKIGKPVGLNGDLKLHLLTDFPEQFKKGKTVQTSTNKALKIKAYNADRSIVRFDGYNTPEDASILTNQVLISSIQDSKKDCTLGDDEYFWFDVIGCKVMENDEEIGSVVEIDRFGGGDFLRIDTASELVLQKLPKNFILPFQDHFIDRVDVDAKIVFVKGAKDVLEAS